MHSSSLRWQIIGKICSLFHTRSISPYQPANHTYVDLFLFAYEFYWIVWLFDSTSFLSSVLKHWHSVEVEIIFDWLVEEIYKLEVEPRKKSARADILLHRYPISTLYSRELEQGFRSKSTFNLKPYINNSLPTQTISTCFLRSIWNRLA